MVWYFGKRKAFHSLGAHYVSMKTGSIPLADLQGGFDLQSTVESGQTFLWHRESGSIYDRPAAYGGTDWYTTVHDGEVIRARQVDDLLEWEATTDAEPILVSRLRLDDDLPSILGSAPPDPLFERAKNAYRGMRLVRDPLFPCLVSFICSAQMRVARIHGMQSALAQTFGDAIDFDGKTYYAYPEPERIAATTETELRDLGLGYRAPYVQRSAALYVDGVIDPATVREIDYEDAREALQAFVGVGEKVADCVLLFALDHLDAVPLDTWIQRAIAEHYPHCEKGNYGDTSRAIREEFGPYPGYVQTYVFHYLRE